MKTRSFKFDIKLRFLTAISKIFSLESERLKKKFLRASVIETDLFTLYLIKYSKTFKQFSAETKY